MFILKAENRDTNLKPKQLRRSGIIPVVLYGKNLEQSLSLQITGADAARLIKTHSPGSRAELMVGDKKYPVLLREVAATPATGELEHISFQTLLAGEVITSTIDVVLLNRELVTGMVQQPLSEISYRALPANLIDKIEIDLDGMKTGASMKISDLDIAGNPDIEILTPLDAMVFSITDPRASASASSEAEEGEEAAGDEAEAE